MTDTRDGLREIECATPTDHAEVERLYAEGWDFVRAATFRRDGKRIARITLAPPELDPDRLREDRDEMRRLEREDAPHD